MRLQSKTATDLLMGTKVKTIDGIRFKEYNQNQEIDVSLYLPDLIAKNSVCRIIDDLVERIEMSELEAEYKNYGCPSYHPKMMIKVWVYAYSTKVYTSRPLAKKLREDLGFIWLAGKNAPSFKTLCSFRAGKLKGLCEVVIKQMLLYLVEEGYIDLQDLYIDGSKWEANANKYKVTWKKNTARYKESTLTKIEDFLKQVAILQEEEDVRYGSKDLKEHQSNGEIEQILSSADLDKVSQKIQAAILSEKEAEKKKALMAQYKECNKLQEKLSKYELQEAMLGQRNSYSKTDPDATYMQLKDERGAPAYNVQISTSNQFIVHASMHQNTNDSVAFIPHIAAQSTRLEQLGFAQIAEVTADAGYGSEENYHYCVTNSTTAYIKFPLWYQEVSGALVKQEYRSENWQYTQSEDCYVCPQGRKLTFKKAEAETSKNGYQRTVRKYECESCANCPVFKECRGEIAAINSNRTVQRSEQMEMYKQEARERLATERGKEKRSQRSVDVETPFGSIKYNMRHQRFILRGIESVSIEFWLLSMAHNIRKVHSEKTGMWAEHYAQRARKRA